MLLLLDDMISEDKQIDISYVFRACDIRNHVGNEHSGARARRVPPIQKLMHRRRDCRCVCYSNYYALNYSAQQREI